MSEYKGTERRSDYSDIARLQSDVHHLEGQVIELRADVKSLLAMVNQSKGGWKVILMVAGVAGTAGAALAKIVPFLGAMPK